MCIGRFDVRGMATVTRQKRAGVALVRKNERGLLMRRGDFDTILEPGEYVFWDPLRRVTVEQFDLNTTRFEHRLRDFIVDADRERASKYFTDVKLDSTQVALVYENERLAAILAPGTRSIYWKGFVAIRVEVIDIGAQFTIAPALATTIAQARGAQGAGADAVQALEVPEHHIALFYVDGKHAETLAPGRHVHWRFHRNIRAEVIDLRMQNVEVSGQEILTRDRVSLRVNLSASYRVVDPVLAHAKQSKPLDYLYRELQLGLRAAVGTRTLDELLDDKSVIDQVVSEHVRAKIEGYGMELMSVGAKDIVLPGEIKAILSRVVEAQKAAEANVIRRREETAATRSLLNTAKVMEDNPTALRLKELETLEKVTEKIDKISVFGGLDSILDGLVKMKR